MALPARLPVALLFIQVTYLIAAQHDLVTGVSTKPAATIEELMQQMPALFDEEKRLLDQHPTAPAAVTIGDSITAFGYKEDGWVTRLKHDYPEMVFVNKGVPMGNSRSSLIISDWTLGNVQSPLYDKPNRLKLVTLCFGANDASTNRRNSTWRMVPESEYKTNLIDSINIFRAQHVDNIVLITPPPVVVPPRIDRRLDVTETYANIAKDIGLKLQVPVVDIFTGIQKAVPNWQIAAMLPDGLHLNAVGNQVVHDLVLAAIKDFYPDL